MTTRCRSNSCPPKSELRDCWEDVELKKYDNTSYPGTDFGNLEDVIIDDAQKQYLPHEDAAAIQYAALTAELEALKARNLELDDHIGVLTPVIPSSGKGLNPQAAPFCLSESEHEKYDRPPTTYTPPSPLSWRPRRYGGSHSSGSTCGATPESSFCGEPYAPMYNDWWSSGCETWAPSGPPMPYVL